MQKDRLTNAYATETPASETTQGVARAGQTAAGRFLTVADIAELLHCSPRTIHELTRTCCIPHRRIEGTRRCLFVPDEVDAWVDGAELYVSETPRGGRVVRPNMKERGSARASQAAEMRPERVYFAGRGDSWSASLGDAPRALQPRSLIGRRLAAPVGVTLRGRRDLWLLAFDSNTAIASSRWSIVLYDRPIQSVAAPSCVSLYASDILSQAFLAKIGGPVARKTVLVSDISGDEIVDGKGASIRITFHDARKGVRELDVTDAEAEKIGGRQVARRGRRPKAASA